MITIQTIATLTSEHWNLRYCSCFHSYSCITLYILLICFSHILKQLHHCYDDSRNMEKNLLFIYFLITSSDTNHIAQEPLELTVYVCFSRDGAAIAKKSKWPKHTRLINILFCKSFYMHIKRMCGIKYTAEKRFFFSKKMKQNHRTVYFVGKLLPKKIHFISFEQFDKIHWKRCHSNLFSRLAVFFFIYSLTVFVVFRHSPPHAPQQRVLYAYAPSPYTP